MTADHPTPTIPGQVPGTYVRLLFEYLAARGHDPVALLGEAAPPIGQDLQYPAARWRQLLERAAAQLGDPLLGLHVGVTIRPAHLGPLGYVLLASASLSAALERYLHYQRLVHDVSPVRYYADGEALVLEWNSESRAVGLLANQCGMAALLSFARQITVAEAAPLRVDFVEPAPPDADRYCEFFGCPVRFGQGATRMGFPLAFLALPLRQPDPALAALLEPQVEAMLQALPPRDALEQAIRRLLSQQFLRGEPSLEEVAVALNLSGRTLRRRLQEQGLSFRELQEDTRRRLAEGYLRDARLTLAEVAMLLGYSEQSAFNRAFARWTGTSPRRWRGKSA